MRVGVAGVAGVVLVGCSSHGMPPHPAPTRPTDRQVAWLVAATSRLPLSTQEVSAHLDAGFRQEFSVGEVNAVLGRVAPITGVSVVQAAGRSVELDAQGHGTPITISMVVDDRGLISGLLIKNRPGAQVETTWAAIDASVHSLAPQTHLLVAEITPTGCRPIHGVAPDVPAPVASMFKLYVLDALARAVGAGTVTWGQLVPTTESLPGRHDDRPTALSGSRATVAQIAEKMISVSDNRSADVLINLLGRAAIEAAARAAGIADPARNEPFLTSYEAIVLKLHDWPRLAEGYAAASPAARSRMLTDVVDPTPFRDLGPGPGTAPRSIDTIEWFASAADVCRVYASLRTLSARPGLAPVAQVLAINDGGLHLDPVQWSTTWFKGGSEVGVATAGFLATTTAGRTYVVSLLTEDPRATLGDTAGAQLATVRAAFELATTG